MELKTIIEVIPQMKTGTGFFSKFTDPVWAETFDTPSKLDVYFAGTFGKKYISDFTEMFVDSETGTISNNDLADLADTIYMIHAKQWEKLYNDLIVEYNPIENTDAYETTSDTRSIMGTNGNTRTLNTTKTDSGTSSSASTGTTTGSTTGSNNTSDSTDNTVFGYDSSTAVGLNGSTASKTIQDASNSSTESSSCVNVTNGNTETDTGTVTDAGNSSQSETFSRSYHKHGNIGVMTNVQLLRDDVDFWKWDFIEQICRDILKHIALKVY